MGDPCSSIPTHIRRSCRSFLGQPVDSETIEKILSFEMKPLY